MESEKKEHIESMQEQLNAQQQALAQIYKSVEKTRKYIMWSGIFSIAMFVVPVIIFAFALPRIIGSFNSALGGISGNENSSAVELLSEPSLRESLENLQNLGL
jgi:hypothetical protein